MHLVAHSWHLQPPNVLCPIETCSYLSSKMSDNPSLIMLATATVLAWAAWSASPFGLKSHLHTLPAPPQPAPRPRLPTMRILLCPTPSESHHCWPHKWMLLVLYPIWRPLGHMCLWAAGIRLVQVEMCGKCKKPTRFQRKSSGKQTKRGNLSQ